MAITTFDPAPAEMANTHDVGTAVEWAGLGADHADLRCEPAGSLIILWGIDPSTPLRIVGRIAQSDFDGLMTSWLVAYPH